MTMSWKRSLLVSFVMLFFALCLALITGWPMSHIVWSMILGSVINNYFIGVELAKQARAQEAVDKERKRQADIEAMFGKK